MGVDRLFHRYQEMQRYVEWDDEDVARIVAAAGCLNSHLPALVDDFYEEINRHPDARKVITGGAAQVDRLRHTLINWIHDLLSGVYDRAYVERRWRVGNRHVEIGLDQLYTNSAISRLRSGLCQALHTEWLGDEDELIRTTRSLNTLFDLEQAIIEDAYKTHYLVERQNEERLAMLGLVNGSMIAIVRLDGVVAYFSPQAERLSGYTADEIVGQPFPALFPTNGEPDGPRDHWRRALAGETTLGWELSIRCSDGSERCMVWQTRYLDDYGDSPGILLVGIDITPVKLDQQRALQSQRLAVIGEMVTGLTHESRNALQCIQACLDLLSLADRDRPHSLELIHSIQKAQDRLHYLYEDIRNYAAPIVLDPFPCDFHRLILAVWAQVQGGPGGGTKEASLLFTEPVVDMWCEVDAFRFEQVFRNIFDNALAAGAAPVEIVIDAEPHELDKKPALRIIIRDNGPGMSADQRRRVFDPFFTTKVKGTGLGMSIVRRIVEAHHGRIAALESDLPGAVFEIIIPRGKV